LVRKRLMFFCFVAEM